MQAGGRPGPLVRPLETRAGTGAETGGPGVDEIFETVGFVLAVLGLAGVVDHFWSAFPLFDVVNGLLLPRLGLEDHQLLVDGTVLLVGVVVLAVGAALEPSDRAAVE